MTFREDLGGWSKVADKGLFLWCFASNHLHFLIPHPNLDALTPDIKYYVDHGAVGIFHQGSHASAGGEFSDLRMWVVAHSLCDPDADGPALQKEFLDGYYGPAAGAIQKYLDVIHKPVRESDFALRKEMATNGPYLAPDVIAESEAALREGAKAAAGNPHFENRVRHARMPVLFILGRRGPGSPTWNAVESRCGKDVSGAGNNGACSVERKQVPNVTPGIVGNRAAEFVGQYPDMPANDGDYVAVKKSGSLCNLRTGAIALWLRYNGDQEPHWTGATVLDTWHKTGEDARRNPVSTAGTWVLGRNYRQWNSFQVFEANGGRANDYTGVLKFPDEPAWDHAIQGRSEWHPHAVRWDGNSTMGALEWPNVYYVDRWMYEDETPRLAEQVKARGGKEIAEGARQGQVEDPFAEAMWKKYRTAPGMPPTDGWKKEKPNPPRAPAPAGAARRPAPVVTPVEE